MQKAFPFLQTVAASKKQQMFFEQMKSLFRDQCQHDAKIKPS